MRTHRTLACALAAILIAAGTVTTGIAALDARPAAAATTAADSLGPTPVPCTGARTDGPACTTASGDGSLSVTPHVLAPGGIITVTFTPLNGATDLWDLDDVGFTWSNPRIGQNVAVTTAVQPGCAPQVNTCSFKVATNAANSNWGLVFLNFTVVSGDICNLQTGAHCELDAGATDYFAITNQPLLNGRVTGPTGGLANSTVDISGGGKDQTTTTDNNGNYSVRLAPGTYSVSAPATPDGRSAPNVTACSGATAGSDCTVTLAAGDIGTASFAEGGNVQVTNVATAHGSPASGPLTGGTAITITGTGFGATGSTDTVGLVPTGGGAAIAATNVHVANDTTITAVTADATTRIAPGSSTLLTDAIVTSANGSSAASSADRFEYDAAAVVTAVTPNGGPVKGGTSITVTGAGFFHQGVSGVTGVAFAPPGGTPVAAASFTATSDTSITVQTPDATAALPAGTSTLATDVIVSTAAGPSPVTSDDRFTFGGPIVTAVSPNVGPIAPGASDPKTIVVTGSGFTGATKVSWLLPGTTHGFNVTEGFSVNAAGTQITVTLPSGVADQITGLLGPNSTEGDYPFEVHVAVNDQVSPDSNGDLYTFAGPKVTSVSANHGPIVPGTSDPKTITVTGSGFNGATKVAWLIPGSIHGFNVDTGYTVNPAGTQITVTLPSGVADLLTGLYGTTSTATVYPFDVHVFIGGIESPSSTADTYEFDAPEVNSVSADHGPIVPGASDPKTITVNGTGLNGATKVSWLDPALGHGFNVTEGFSVNAAGTQMTVTLPSGVADLLTGLYGANSTAPSYPLDVHVFLNGIGSPISSGDTYTFEAPKVASVSPNDGPIVPGASDPTTIFVTGSGFTGATKVAWLIPGSTHGFNVTEGFTVNAAGTQIKVTLPSGVADLLTGLYGPNSTASNYPLDVHVFLNGVESPSSSADTYTFEAPKVASVSPNEGATSQPGGDFIFVTGSGFTGATKVAWLLPGSTHGISVDTGFTVNAAGTQIKVTMPTGIAALLTQLVGPIFPGASYPLDVHVFLNGVESPTSPGDLYTFQGPAGPVAPACGAETHCSSGTGTDPNGSVNATSTDPSGAITATGQGSGGLTVGRYASDPARPATFNASGSYFDVRASTPNQFTSVTIKDCDLANGNTIEWWNPAANGGAGAWLQVSNQTVTPGPPACVTAVVNTTSSPNLSQLTGTIFGVGIRRPTTVVLLSSTRATQTGEPVLLLAGVLPSGRGPWPTGTVTFADNGVPIAGCTSRPIGFFGVICTVRWSATIGSPHVITATYSGDASDAPATSARVTITVAQRGGRVGVRVPNGW